MVTIAEPIRRPAHRSPWNRVAFAAAHLAAEPVPRDRPVAAPSPASPIDWEATIAFRHHLWDLGFGVAEAMDTAQRGTDLPWPLAAELIAASCQAADGRPIVCGAMTDQLDPVEGGASGRSGSADLTAIVEAYGEQVEHIERVGGTPVLMCSRHLAASARSPDDYAQVYREVIDRSRGPVLLHWLGPAFDPALAGYWGSSDRAEAASVVSAVIEDGGGKVAGVKLSLLDAGFERWFRARLPQRTRLFTGDDFNYPELILGDGTGHSDALLGVFDPLAPLAALALDRLAAGEEASARALLDASVPMARLLFEAPTMFYKTGVVFLAYLAGHQDHFVMVGGRERDRTPAHLVELVGLAAPLGIFPDPELTAARFARFCAANGIDDQAMTGDDQPMTRR